PTIYSLQWGRLPKEAETYPMLANWAFDLSMLQWGRLPKEAETSDHEKALVLNATLQWGRLPKEAETRPRRRHALRQGASMGPPPEGGGDPAWCTTGASP